ncbi:MAG: NYN domain-containing protein [Candidatus Taylorbacteria bacterium]|nr:NYN domain-containing protein [Candidatus Taylorbacteria bacterium]
MLNKTTKKRYAFIDVQNTASTTRKLLGFLIDWNKLYIYLRDKWGCEKVFFYSGIDEGDIETTKEFESLAKTGCVVKTRTVFTYKKPDKTISIKCVNCGTENVEIVNMGYNHKSNCDVDLTVDAMEYAGDNKEFLIFTGDGDFDYLIKRIIDRGTRVYVVSSNAGIKRPGLNTRHLSTRLKEVINQYQHGKIDLINIDSWKMKIQKKM